MKIKKTIALVSWLLPAAAMAQRKFASIPIGLKELQVTYPEIILTVALLVVTILFLWQWSKASEMRKKPKKQRKDNSLNAPKKRTTQKSGIVQTAKEQRHKVATSQNNQQQNNKQSSKGQQQEDKQHTQQTLQAKLSDASPATDPPQSPTHYWDLKKDEQKKFYARQDAQNENRLIDVSPNYDKYVHYYVITLDANSDTEGIVEIIEENAGKIFNNSDNSKCCTFDKIVTSDNFEQTPGRVRIDGNTATVTKKIFVTTKNN